MAFDVQALIDELGPTGGTVHLPPSGDWQPFSDRGRPIRFLGVGTGQGNIHSTVGRFDAVDVENSEHKCAVHLGGAGSTIEYCAIRGPAVDNRARGNGLWLQGHFARAVNVHAHWFRDAGFLWKAGTVDGTNGNSTGLLHCRALRCGDGFVSDGEETNSGYIVGCYATGNDRYGFFESSFLGKGYAFCHSANNGRPAGAGAPQFGANYAQGGSLATPTRGGSSSYAGYLGCYSEGSLPGWANFFQSSQIHIVQAGGNLERTARGWPGADGRPTPFPGTISGGRSKLGFVSPWDFSDTDRERMDSEKLSRGSAGRYALESYRYVREQWDPSAKNGEGDWITVYPSDTQRHYVFERWQDDTSPTPEWFSNLRLLDRLDGAGAAAWRCPLGWTDERHASGAGNLAITGAIVNTPFDFALAAGVEIPPGQTREIVWQHNYLRDSSAGYTGSLVLSGPHLQPRAQGAGRVTHSGLERIGPTRVRTVLENHGTSPVFQAVVIAGRRHTIAIPKAGPRRASFSAPF